MTTDSAGSPLVRALLVLAAAALLFAALQWPGDAQAKAASPAAGGAFAVEGAKSLGRDDSCNRQIRRQAGRQLTRAQRRSQVLRRRRCQRPPAASTGGGPIYWGAWIGDQLTGDQAPWDMSAVTKFEANAGKSLSLVNFSSPFADCSSDPCSFYDFPAKEMENIQQHGAIPFFSWASQSTPASVDEPDFQLSDVIAGRYDDYIREFAQGAKDWGHPFFLRFNWEMNATWFEWAEGVNGNQSGEYVTAWRHVHDIFTAVGADNVSWVWCPYVDPGNKLQDLASLYPGDEYVDWTGLDGYNWGTNPASPKGWKSFDELFRSTYDNITGTIAPSKPLVVSEVGSSEYGGSKAAWIEDALASVRSNYPKLRGLIWFDNYADGMDWPIETSSAATSAFSSGIQDPAYLGNSFASAGPGKIQPVG
jgi:beta-mannanase